MPRAPPLPLELRAAAATQAVPELDLPHRRPLPPAATRDETPGGRASEKARPPSSPPTHFDPEHLELDLDAHLSSRGARLEKALRVARSQPPPAPPPERLRGSAPPPAPPLGASDAEYDSADPAVDPYVTRRRSAPPPPSPARAAMDRENVDASVKWYLRANAFEEAAQVLADAGRFAEAAHLLLDGIGTGASPLLGPKEKLMAERAAECYEAAGNAKAAANVYLGLGDHSRAAAVLERSGDVESAARLRAAETARASEPPRAPERKSWIAGLLKGRGKP